MGQVGERRLLMPSQYCCGPFGFDSLVFNLSGAKVRHRHHIVSAFA